MPSQDKRKADEASRKEDGDRKGKGKAKDQDEDQNQNRGHEQNGDGENQQQMKEIRRPPPLPAVKGTMGAIESPSRRTFFSGSPNSPMRNTHSRGPSYDTSLQFKTPDSPSPNPPKIQQDHEQQQLQQNQDQEQCRVRERPVFRSDPTLRSCFDRLKLIKKDEIRSLFGA